MLKIAPCDVVLDIILLDHHYIIDALMCRLRWS